MDTQKCQVFLKTVELGSFTEAAAALGYTQSGISHIISAIEKELGLTLLSRGRSGIRITGEGEQLLPYFRALAAADREFNDATARLHGLEQGVVRIGTFASVSLHCLPLVIKSFKEQYPCIEFELLHGDYRDIEAAVRESRADCGFTRMAGLSDEFEITPLFTDRFMAVLPSDHPMACETQFPIECLSDYPYIKLMEGTDLEIQSIFTDHKVRPDVKYTAEDDFAIIAMAEAGLGVSVLPEFILHRSPHNIAAVPLVPTVTRTIGIIKEKEKRLSPAADKFVEHITCDCKNIFKI